MQLEVSAFMLLMNFYFIRRRDVERVTKLNHAGLKLGVKN